MNTQPETVMSEDSTVSPVLFSDFEIAPELLEALDRLGLKTPTQVQQESFAPAKEGKDLLVSSRTGSGKTYAFFLPIITRLMPLLTNAAPKPNVKRSNDTPRYRERQTPTHPLVLVLCPTRELAQQVTQAAIALVRPIKGARVANVIGGMPMMRQIEQLRGAQIVIATPGRLVDLVNRRVLSLADVKTLVADEADRMLDLGFQEDLEEISELAGNREQTLMFSATFSDRIVKLAEAMMNDPLRINVQNAQTQHQDIEQTLNWSDGLEHKKKILRHWLSQEDLDQAVVFANTQIDTEEIADMVSDWGHQVVALHGAMPQKVRNMRIKSLREGRARILVATDVAARGLDIPAISHVINFGLPMKQEDYVHRIGRTGRAGRKGRAITLVTWRDRRKVGLLEDYLKSRIPTNEIEGLEPTPQPKKPAQDRKGGGGAGRDRRPQRGFDGGKPTGRFADRPMGSSRRSDQDRTPFESRKPQHDAPRVERAAFHKERAPRDRFDGKPQDLSPSRYLDRKATDKDARPSAGRFAGDAPRPAAGRRYEDTRTDRYASNTNTRFASKPYPERRSRDADFAQQLDRPQEKRAYDSAKGAGTFKSKRSRDYFNEAPNSSRPQREGRGPKPEDLE